MLTRDALHSLATAEPGRLVVSAYARTDPRDPANTSSNPAWHIALRDGLSTLSERLEASDNRDDRLAFRSLRERIEEELVDMEPAERARSVALFFDIDGGQSQRFSLQLPLRGDAVVGDTRPFVSPLVDIADRGAPTGVILASGQLVRLLQIEQSEVTEPENSTFELTLGDWRPFGGSAGGSPARGKQVISQKERYEARVDAQRHHLFESAVTQTAKRLHDLGWERIVLVCETEVASRFREALPAELSEQVIAESDLNLVGEEPSAIADALEPLIDDAWLRRTTALVELARGRAEAGGAAALGAQETFSALAEGRVAHLVLDPEHDFSAVAGMIHPAIGGPADMVGERAVETAVATGAQVTALAGAASQALRDAGGIVALLRY
jgi:protein required for attachment to host cells